MVELAAAAAADADADVDGFLMFSLFEDLGLDR